ncbi:MAG: MFS transporter [Acidimicrobiales bacterium]
MSLGKESSITGSEHGTAVGPRYKWLVLSNTTLGVLMATMNASSLIIALPAIFRGLKLNPLNPANFTYLLWILMGYLLVTAVLVVTVGKIGDIYGRVKIYNVGFAVFTIGSIGLSVIWSHGSAGALEIIIIRLVQGVGAAFLMSNSVAIITDAFPANERGMALGVNMIAAMAGSFIGLLVGGFLATIDWRWVFLMNVPIGIIGTIWAYISLKEIGIHTKVKLDWIGNATFALGLTGILVGITYGIRPYGGHVMGWTNPFVIATIVGGLILLVIFGIVESRVAEPMFNLSLFRIRAFTAGNLASLLAAIGRGGLMFMMIIWLQGVWLPLHGYSFKNTPLWAGIFLLPMTGGFLLAGPLSGYMSDRFGARPFATGGMLVAAINFGLLTILPVNFPYPLFAAIIFADGLAMGMFISPNTAGIMNSVPPEERGSASGMRVTFFNAGMPLSLGIFFSLMALGLADTVPHSLFHGLVANGIPAHLAHQISSGPPIGYLFAAMLGYNPIKTLLGHAVYKLPPSVAARLTGHTFFPSLIAGPFKHGLTIIFLFAATMSLIAAAASWMRGARYVHHAAGESLAVIHDAALLQRDAVLDASATASDTEGRADVDTAISAEIIESLD